MLYLTFFSHHHISTEVSIAVYPGQVIVLLPEHHRWAKPGQKSLWLTKGTPGNIWILQEKGGASIV